MPGYAYPVGATGSGSGGEVGSAAVASLRLTDENAPEILLTAASKTKVTSVLLTNSSGGILPVDLFIVQGNVATYLAKGFRVHKRRYAVESLVSGDSRVQQPTVGETVTLTEVVLNAGDKLMAYCKIGDVIDVTVNYLGGIN